MSTKSQTSHSTSKQELPLTQRRLAQSVSFGVGETRVKSAATSTKAPAQVIDGQIDARACTSGWLSYLGFGISGWFIFKAEKTNYFVRFHALQAIFYTATILLLELALSFLPGFDFTGGLLGIAAFLGWIALLLSAYQGQYLKIPLLAFCADHFARQTRQQSRQQ